MARNYSFGDAKNLSTIHKNRMTSLNIAHSKAEAYEAQVQRCIIDIKDKQMMEILSDVPVEELNRSKGGLRVSLLRDNNITNVWQVFSLSQASLEAINGISEKNAQAFKEEAKRMVLETRKSLRIVLNIDSIDDDYNQLVLAAYRHKMTKQYGNIARKLLESNGQYINNRLSQLEAGTSFLKWTFASRANKELANQAFVELMDLINSDYDLDSKAVIAQVEKAARFTIDDAWNDFKLEPISYTNLIEGLVAPDEEEKSKIRFGMSGELAEAIDATVLNLNGLNCTLRRYQEWGVKYIIHQKKSLLGDEMGLGKTVQAIAAMVHLRNNGATHFLVVCPASVLSNWCREIKKMSNLNAIRLHGNNKEDHFKKWLGNGGVAVTTYEATAGFEELLYNRYHMLVVDEAHFIKNPEAKRTQNIRAISKNADNLLLMTGTALENNVHEMIELVSMLDVDIANKVKSVAFMSRAEAFRETVCPVYFRRRREDVLKELPELLEQKEWCTLMPEEEYIYDMAVLSQDYTNVRRVSWNVPDINMSSKARRMLEIINQATIEGRKILVFSYYLETVYTVSRMLCNVCFGPITGDLSPAQRQDVVDKFNNGPAGSVLVAQIQSGGVGLNIQAASVIIFCEPQFKPSTENQALSRAYRMGQTRNVLVFRLLADDTVDEQVMEMLEEKQMVFDAFADTSAIADETKEIDQNTFNKILEEEMIRIKEKHNREYRICVQ